MLSVPACLLYPRRKAARLAGRLLGIPHVITESWFEAAAASGASSAAEGKVSARWKLLRHNVFGLRGEERSVAVGKRFAGASTTRVEETTTVVTVLMVDPAFYAFMFGLYAVIGVLLSNFIL